MGAPDGVFADILESAVVGEAPSTASGPGGSGGGAVKVRPIQMGEFMRKYVSRRLLAVSDGDISSVMTAMRQIGVGSPGGAEALAIFHQLLYQVWKAGGLSTPLARIKVDEKTVSAASNGTQFGRRRLRSTRGTWPLQLGSISRRPMLCKMACSPSRWTGEPNKVT